jgi:ABC-2 type transport system permease protein
MFKEIFRFEIKYRLRKPDTWLFFLFFFIASAIPFCTERGGRSHVFVNSPQQITDFFTGMGLIMMVVSGSVMSGALYRDIEFNVYGYYLTQPITRAGYFWGRFLGSFLFVLIIGSSMLWGAMAGPYVGLRFGWIGPDLVGPFYWVNYLQPFFGYAVPNLFLTSAIFYALVAFTRNTRSLYAGSVLLFFSYMMSLFVLKDISNKVWVYLLDPFAIDAERLFTSACSPQEMNSSLVAITGWMLVNRILWSIVGIAMVFGTWSRFSFTRFFRGKEVKGVAIGETVKIGPPAEYLPASSADFTHGYRRGITLSLIKIELRNIFRDNYFRLIMLVAIGYMVFTFWTVSWTYGVSNFRRTAQILNYYEHDFRFFPFLIILFYTGEALHRERQSRFAAINDSLPPADRVFFGSKLTALLLLALLIAVLPMLIGVGVQLAKGFQHFDISVYLEYCFGIAFPRYVEIVLLCFFGHSLINNKFAAHAAGIIVWWILWLSNNGAVFNYNLLLYSYTPNYTISEVNGIGPTTKPVFWFTLYWLFDGGLLILLAALLFPRGVLSSFRDRMRLAGGRFSTGSKVLAALLFLGLLWTGIYNYYQVSYRGTYLLPGEAIQRRVQFERQLKQYEHDPLPTIIRYRLFTDIFPSELRTATRAEFTIVNRTGRPINRLLLDGGELADYQLSCNGKPMAFSYPLIFPRAKLSPFKPAGDTSANRLYVFSKPLAPGDTALLELHSTRKMVGFENRFEPGAVLHNGTAFNGGLPDLGYDRNDELWDERLRKENGLPKKEDELPPQTNAEGRSSILFNASTNGLTGFEATISTAADQVAIAPGRLQKTWMENGRRYFHYVLDSPQTYMLFPVFSGRYSILRDSAVLPGGRTIPIELYYNPAQAANLTRFMSSCKDGLTYYNATFGPYQFGELRFLETSNYTDWSATYPGGIAFAEWFGWDAAFNSPDQVDYCYFYTAYQLAHQWWMFQVAPSHTQGAYNIEDGLSRYSALLVYEKKRGKDAVQALQRFVMDDYRQQHRYSFGQEQPLVGSRDYYVRDFKAGAILYGLKDLIGEDTLNAAIREFRDTYAYRDRPPFAGSNDLYSYIKRKVPDSLQYYLTDSWEKITIYDNKIIAASAVPINNGGSYKVHLLVRAGKLYTNDAGTDVPATQMNDYIDIGIFGSTSRDNGGRSQSNPLYIKKYKLTAGEHAFDIIVNGKPISVGIDPYEILIDTNPDDNTMNVSMP